MHATSVTELRGKLQEILDQVHYTKAPVLISKNGKPWAMIQPLPEGDTDLQELIEKKTA